MITEKDTIKCEAIFNDSHTHRYLWKRAWDKDKPTVTVIMLNPCQADNIVTDTTTSLVVNNIAKLEKFGGVTIVNLFSLLTTKLRFNSSDILNDKENDDYIKRATEDASTVILAWGQAASNISVAERAKHVTDMLDKQKEKFYVISDGERIGLHPLVPAVRSKWLLVDAKEYIDKLKSISTEDNIDKDKEKSHKKPSKA